MSVRDLVQVHVTADLPIRARALPFANRVELRFGKAFPVALLVDEAALARLGAAIESARQELRDADGPAQAQG
ncbi:hypothetical protein [Qaidamihabitans albus]|uniref:hypothetical protein n=1 Tax=Qaidamihabitans albus TaxID=2795733 RepID=UPI0018F274C0|nr:hypothetical protein [Qaidamihabitans albus]